MILRVRRIFFEITTLPNINDLGDGGAAMRALRRSQPWEAEVGGPADAGLVLAAGGRHD